MIKPKAPKNTSPAVPALEWQTPEKGKKGKGKRKGKGGKDDKGTRPPSKPPNATENGGPTSTHPQCLLLRGALRCSKGPTDELAQIHVNQGP